MEEEAARPLNMDRPPPPLSTTAAAAPTAATARSMALAGVSESVMELELAALLDSAAADPANPAAADMPMDNYDQFIHGRIDPGIPSNLSLVPSLDLKDSVKTRVSSTGTDFFCSGSGSGSASGEEIQESKKCSGSNVQFLESSRKTSDKCCFLALPNELIDQILSFLGPIELAIISSTCHLLYNHAKSEVAWQRHVQENVPGVRLTSPYPCNSFKELYASHDPHWFLSKYKIWFCDYYLTGKMVLMRYDPRRGCIEGYRLVAERPPPTFAPWELDDEVIIHSFEPRCHLHLDQPVIQLDALSLERLMVSSGNTKPNHKFAAETPMRLSESNTRGVFSNFLLAKPVQVRQNMQLWPPLTIPARQRVRNASQEAFVGVGHKPQKRSEVSNQAFRVRRWMEMTGPNGSGVHLGEEVYTYATLDPKVYTPTEEKPFRGIWVGDYSGHGCEFLLMNQPDNETPFDEAAVVQGPDETVEEWQARKREERIYRGSIEAIKLTGDPNIPRGEYTFISDDISRTGFVRTATEGNFKGARIVRSRGHVAARMFRDDKYIESQLIMISHNRLAQYWVGFGHISFYERVDIDQFLNPYNDPAPRLC